MARDPLNVNRDPNGEAGHEPAFAVPDRAPAPDVVSSAQVLALLGGISRSRLAQIIETGDRNGFPRHREVPSPGFQGVTRIWDRASVIAWQQARTKPKRRGIYIVTMMHARGHNISQIARGAGVHRHTVTRWLRELGRI